MVLYHGSYAEVPEPDLRRCARFKDFGRGFYLTISRKQALSFVRLSTRKAVERGVEGASSRHGFVSRFVVDGNALGRVNVLSFPDANRDWLRCVVAHRMRRSPKADRGPYAPYDIISGKIANDQTNITLALYMDGIFGAVGSDEAEESCIARLLPQRLDDQHCFRTPAALGCLRYEGAEVVWT
ncbi:MAG: DUF3990 domain-containing protein [Atopobiaceae bacterium]|nr:DUF3990 domain-containing protein [Atopobiaceae bacterium]